MGKGRPSISTRTEAFTPRELPLPAPDGPPPLPVRRSPPSAAERIRETLRRWLEEEM